MSTSKEIVEAGKRIYELLSQIAKDASALGRQRHLGRICKALRQIYFTPDGVRDVLKKIADGKVVDRTEFEQIMSKFRDAENVVARALDDLSNNAILHDLRVDIRDSDLLMQIRYRKLHLRNAILRDFGEETERISSVKRAKAGIVLKELLELNAHLSELDKRLNPNLPAD